MTTEQGRKPKISEQERATVLDDRILYMNREEARAYIAEYWRARGLPERVPAACIPPVDESRSA